MLLIPKIKSNGDLTLDAYSFSSQEINAVSNVLSKARIRIVNEKLTKDSQGRSGFRFLIIAGEVIKLEKTLNLKFVGKENSTKVTLGQTYYNADGDGHTASSYKCSRTDTPPHSCETVLADDEIDALVKCGLIASTNNWLGAVPTPGQC